MKRPLLSLLSVAILAVGCQSESAPPTIGSQAIAIVGAKLIDGTGAEPTYDSVIVVRGGRIESVGRRYDTAVPEEAEIVNGAGKVVIPGLIDLHCHYGGGREEVERQYLAQLRMGVTTTRGMGNDREENLATMADAEAGVIPGPRLNTAGVGFIYPDGNPPGMNAPTSEEEAREMVRSQTSGRLDFVKMWIDDWNGTKEKITPEIRAAIVDEARLHGIPTVAHVFDEADIWQLAEVGVRQFLHGVRSHEVGLAFGQKAKELGLSFAPGLSKTQDSWFLPENPDQLSDPDVRAGFRAATLERLENVETREQILASPATARWRTIYARQQHFVRAMRDAGVTLLVGSDSGAGNVPFGWATHHEMRLFVEAGLSPVQAIAAATGNGAKQLEGGAAEFGVLTRGKIADLVLLLADPEADIQNTRKIERVMQGGEWLQR